MQEGILASHPQAAHLALKPHVHLRVHSLPYALDPAPHQLNPTISKVGPFHILSNLTAKGQHWVLPQACSRDQHTPLHMTYALYDVVMLMLGRSMHRKGALCLGGSSVLG